MKSAHKRTGFNRWKRGLFASIAGSIVIGKKGRITEAVLRTGRKNG